MNLISPIPDDAPELPKYRTLPEKDDTGKVIKWNKYQIQHHWPYYTEDGKISHYVVRYHNDAMQVKETPPMCLSSENKWVFKTLPGKRILYNLHLLKQYPASQVLVVEGEKCADAATILFKENNSLVNIVPITWQGGSSAVYNTDWTPLKNRSIVLWPDNDKQVDDETGKMLPLHEQPGYSAMLKIAGIINKL